MGSFGEPDRTDQDPGKGVGWAGRYRNSAGYIKISVLKVSPNSALPEMLYWSATFRSKRVAANQCPTALQESSQASWKEVITQWKTSSTEAAENIFRDWEKTIWWTHAIQWWIAGFT